MKQLLVASMSKYSYLFFSIVQKPTITNIQCMYLFYKHLLRVGFKPGTLASVST